jgi:hypothetical protein
MSFLTISEIKYSVGLLFVVSKITIISYTGSGRRRRTITTVKNEVSNGAGFIVNGDLEEIEGKMFLKNSSETERPIVCSVAHVIPEIPNGDQRYFIKLFDPNTKIPKIFELDLITLNRSIDFCCFDFKNEKPDQILAIQWSDNTNEIESGSDCFIIGFPFGDSQQSIVKGVVRDSTYCYPDFASGLDQIYHSAPCTNVNSGSCILDSEGKIIGIHAWGYNQSDKTGFENFTGGPASKSIKYILEYMLNHLNLVLPEEKIS